MENADVSISIATRLVSLHVSLMAQGNASEELEDHLLVGIRRPLQDLVGFIVDVPWGELELVGQIV